MMVMAPRFDDDPLSVLLLPPANETPEQRATRVKKEADARRISDEIDETIKQERAALKKSPALRMLLLGQSESGE
jgi:guanine nucleotide-binding protein alpha-1 subunit